MKDWSCPNTGKFLKLDEEGENYFWKITDKQEQSVKVIENSVPWKLDALCNMQRDSTLCYDVEIEGGKRIGVCVESKGLPNISNTGIDALKSKHEIHWTTPMSEEEVKSGRQVCHSQKVKEMENTTVTSYVEEGDSAACRTILNDAGGCKNCDVKDLYENVFDDEFECILDTHHISDVNKNLDDEMKMIRHTTYSCKDNGWECSEADMNDYNGGAICSMNDDCHQNAEFGICDMKQHKCTSGAINSNCTSHEDCDILSYSEGKCQNNQCVSGKTNISVEYYKSSDSICSGPQDPSMKHKFCGEIPYGSTTLYTGYCTNPIDKSGNKMIELQTCKPFLNTNEIKKIKSDEEDYQKGYIETRGVNFHLQKPAWERLTLCKDVKKVGGELVCATTMEKVNSRLSSVKANSHEEAQKKCSNAHPNLTVTTLRKF